MKKLITITMLLSLMLMQLPFMYAQSTSLPELASIPISRGPSGIAVNPNTHRVYIINSNAHSISVIDDSTNSLISEIMVDGLPVSIALNPNTNKVYVTAGVVNSVYVINGSTNDIEATIGLSIAPSGLAVNPNTNLVYVALPSSASVTVINGATNSVIAGISLGFQAEKIAVNPATNKIYAIPLNVGAISVIDGLTNIVGTTIRFSPDGSRSNALVVNPNTNYIYVSILDNSGSFISVIDGTIDVKLPSNIEIPRDRSFYDLAINPNTNRIYALWGDTATPPNGYIAFINGSTNSIEAEFSIGSTRFSQPQVVINPSTEKLYVSFFTQNVVKVFDGSFTPSDTSSSGTSSSGSSEGTTNEGGNASTGSADINDIERDLTSIRDNLLKETSNTSIRFVINRINRSLGFINGALDAVDNGDDDECDDDLSAAVINLAKALDLFELRQCQGSNSTGRRCIPRGIVNRYLSRLNDLFDALEEKASTDEDEDGLPDVCNISE